MSLNPVWSLWLRCPLLDSENEHTCCMSETKQRVEEEWGTYHYEFYWDWQRQLLSVAGIDLFHCYENSQRQNANDKLRHLGLGQQPANINYSLRGKER